MLAYLLVSGECPPAAPSSSRNLEAETTIVVSEVRSAGFPMKYNYKPVELPSGNLYVEPEIPAQVSSQLINLIAPVMIAINYGTADN